MLKRDILIHSIGSQSSPNIKYEVRLREDGEGHIYLSCQCKSYTTGPYQRGRPVYLRICKHTDRTIIEKARELKALGYSSSQNAGEAIEHILEIAGSSKEFTPIKTTRKLRK